MNKLLTEQVYSPIKDLDIRKNVDESLIWKTCFKKEEFTDKLLKQYKTAYIYTIKFDGTVPVQVSKIKKIKYNDRRKSKGTTNKTKTE